LLVFVWPILLLIDSSFNSLQLPPQCASVSYRKSHWILTIILEIPFHFI
jgi:hypothetical protein